MGKKHEGEEAYIVVEMFLFCSYVFRNVKDCLNDG